jgi:hypothetical protein
MFNTISYYYGYLKSVLGFNKINPKNVTVVVDEAPDESPPTTERLSVSEYDIITNTQPYAEDLGIEASDETFMAAKNYTYMYYSYKNYNSSFAVRGFSRDKTNLMIQNALNEMSKVSGLKIAPWRKGKPVHFSVQFSSKVTYNALAVMDKNKMIISSVRPMTEAVVKTVIQHEILHFLKYKANPPADKWYHSQDKKCVYNINGNAPSLCAAEQNWLRSKYGQA